jgi:hypothetical protein
MKEGSSLTDSAHKPIENRMRYCGHAVMQEYPDADAAEEHSD